jgi:hypothetical protein
MTEHAASEVHNNDRDDTRHSQTDGDTHAYGTAVAAPPRSTGSGEPAPVIGVGICGTVGGNERNISMKVHVDYRPARPREQRGLAADQHDHEELSGEVMKQVKLTVLRLAEQYIPEDPIDHAYSAETTAHNQTTGSTGCREEHPTAIADYGSVPVRVTEHVVSRSAFRKEGPRHPGYGGRS